MYIIMEREEKFVIRPYLKEELAVKYHPHMQPKAAMGKMRRWINMNPELKRRLTEAQIGIRPHSYTPRQVSILVEFLGEP
jgi:hypothetical protein